MSLIARTQRTNSLRLTDSLTLPVQMSSRRYSFVRWTPTRASLRFPRETPSKNMADECEDLDALLFMADLTVDNTYSADGSLVDEWADTLQRFRRFCTLPLLAEKDIILFLNTEKSSNKSSKLHSPSYKQEESHERSIDNFLESIALNADESRKIYVMVADNDESDKNLAFLEAAVEVILSKKAISIPWLRRI